MEKILFKKNEIIESRKKALEKIINLLNSENLDEKIKEYGENYYSNNKFIISYIGTYKGMPSEFYISKTEGFYQGMTGIGAIFAAVGLFHEKQLKSFKNVEHALIVIGLDLIGTKKRYEYSAFYDKYARPYNEKLKNNK